MFAWILVICSGSGAYQTCVKPTVFYSQQACVRVGNAYGSKITYGSATCVQVRREDVNDG